MVLKAVNRKENETVSMERNTEAVPERLEIDGRDYPRNSPRNSCLDGRRSDTDKAAQLDLFRDPFSRETDATQAWRDSS